MKYIYLAFISCLILSCSGTKERVSTENTSESDSTTEMATDDNLIQNIKTSKVDSSFTGLLKKDETEAILKSYYTMKDDLVDSDSAKVSAAAGELVKAYPDSVPQLDSVIVLTTLIRESKDLSVQRQIFKTLSNKLYPILVANRDPEAEETMYLQYCPMALDYEGGSWISSSDEILNPYFGEEMLKCGSIHEKY